MENSCALLIWEERDFGLEIKKRARAHTFFSQQSFDHPTATHSTKATNGWVAPAPKALSRLGKARVGGKHLSYPPTHSRLGLPPLFLRTHSLSLSSSSLSSPLFRFSFAYVQCIHKKKKGKLGKKKKINLLLLPGK